MKIIIDLMAKSFDLFCKTLTHNPGLMNCIIVIVTHVLLTISDIVGK